MSKVIRISDLAKMLNVNRNTIAAWVKSGIVETVNINGQQYLTQDSFNKIKRIMINEKQYVNHANYFLNEMDSLDNAGAVNSEQKIDRAIIDAIFEIQKQVEAIKKLIVGNESIEKKLSHEIFNSNDLNDFQLNISMFLDDNFPSYMQ